VSGGPRLDGLLGAGPGNAIFYHGGRGRAAFSLPADASVVRSSAGLSGGLRRRRRSRKRCWEVDARRDSAGLLGAIAGRPDPVDYRAWPCRSTASRPFRRLCRLQTCTHFGQSGRRFATCGTHCRPGGLGRPETWTPFLVSECESGVVHSPSVIKTPQPRIAAPAIAWA
jgi:hypothetical protein